MVASTKRSTISPPGRRAAFRPTGAYDAPRDDDDDDITLVYRDVRGASPRIAACDAAVHPYAGEYFEPHADAYVFRAGREGLFAQVDDDHETEAWSTAAPGVSNGESYVRFDRVRFNRPASVASRFDAGGAETGLVEAVLFELNDHDRVGFVDPAGYTRFCCAEDLVESTGCVPGRLLS